MNRIERSKKKYRELFGDTTFSFSETDPDFNDIMNRFIFGDVFYQGSLSDKQRELITLVVLTTNQTIPQLKAHVSVALTVGLSPIAIKEAIYQCAPYIGFPKTLNAIYEANEVFREKGIDVQVESQRRAKEEERRDKGLAVQVEIFGDNIRQMFENPPEDQKHIYEYLSAICFGEFYTRSGLDLKTRELLTLCIISTLGGCENQVKSHVRGNLNVGNDKATMIAAITHALPYIGFPRLLNAIACVEKVTTESQ